MTRKIISGKIFGGERCMTITVLNLPEVRVSSASLVQITDKDGSFALLRNRNRASKGELVLTPIGGGIEATPQGIEELKQLLGIGEQAFESKPDLRFMMPGSKANLYREWFLSRTNRETNPARELNEELVDEEKLLEWADFKGSMCWPAGYSVELAKTSKTGQEGKMTLRLIEVFVERLPSDVIGKLVAASKKADSHIYFASSEEIASGRTHGGIEIGAISKALLEPHKTISAFS